LCVLLAALYNDYAEEDIPDVDPSDNLTASDEPAAAPSVSPSPCPVPPPDDGMRPGSPSSSPGPLPRRGRRSTPPVNVTQLMHLAGGLDIDAAISAADAHTDSLGPDWEVPSERAGGESRRIRNKRKAEDITRSAAEDFALLTSRTISEHHAADFLSTVTNVIDFIPKLVYSFSVIN
jgi:hypothetical protein